MENENQQSSEQTKKCPYCSGEVEINVQKCKHCGEWLDTSEREYQKKPGPKNKIYAKNHPSYMTFTLLSLLIPIAGFIVGIVYMTKENLLDRKVGEHAIAMSVLGCILGLVILSLISVL